MATKDLSPLRSPSAELEQLCSLCSSNYENPRVLSCLHFYCELCLDKLFRDVSARDGQKIILCPDCGQETKVPSKGVASLPLDYVMCNQLDMSAFESMQIVCTSCKAKEKAVAQCTDCANFLCPNCVTAHQYMRCFENHKVVTFEDMKSSDGLTIHKPITCPSHAGEFMKYYCYTCQVPICNECMVGEHKQPEHQYERASEAEPKQREELQNLISESKSKVEFCEEATSSLQSCLSDLEMQRDDAKGLIQETFQSYKAILEKQQDHLLQELEDIHSTQELNIMETCHCVEKTIDKIEDACKFAHKLLKHGNTIEMLTLTNLIGSQLLYLINNTPKPDVNVEIKFSSNQDQFAEAVKNNFGCLKKVAQHSLSSGSGSTKQEGNTPPPPHASPLHSTSSFDSDGFALPTGVLSPDDSSVPSSLDMDLSNNVTQYNLAQLAGMVEQQHSASSHQSSPSPTPTPLTLSDLLMSASGTDAASAAAQLNALNNLSALAKLGSVSLNNAGQLLLNGQVIPGLPLEGASLVGGVSILGGSSHHHHHHPRPPSSSSSLRGGLQPSPIDSALGSILNGSSGLTSTPQRGGSPHMDGLNGSHSLNSPLSRGMTPIQGQSGYNPPPRSATAKLNTMQIRCKFGQLGPGKGQFSSPHGFCLGLEEEIIVADTNNHRIQIFDKMGEFKFQFGVPGKEEGQLWYPRKVAVIRTTGKFVICDRGNERSRMQIFSKTGHFIKKIAIRYIDIVAGLAITIEGHIVAVDSVSPTVFVISEAGDLLRWFDCSEYMREPSDIAISGKEYYICDFKGHCVIVFSEDGQFQRRIGCENMTNFPNGIDISDAGDVLVGDSHGNRFHVVVFSREGTILSEFECPYVKVSRCCGLKITSEGYVVTLAKNNHHVLILNTLYIM